MRLPLLLSSPHQGLRVPDEAQPYCILTEQEIIADGDVGAAEIYDLGDSVEAYIAADVARAIVDLNRDTSDRSKDGVIKTHTCWNVPVYEPPLSAEVAEDLLRKYHRPYHERLSAWAKDNRLRLAVDCHTMAEDAPPVAPDPNQHRPHVCLSNNGGETCPNAWIEALADCFREEFGPSVAINDPFQGGYITRTHGEEMPWVQLELSREAFAPNAEKRSKVLRALERWCRLKL